MTSDGERSRLGCCSTRPRVEPFLICRAGAPARTREARVFPNEQKNPSVVSWRFADGPAVLLQLTPELRESVACLCSQ